MRRQSDQFWPCVRLHSIDRDAVLCFFSTNVACFSCHMVTRVTLFSTSVLPSSSHLAVSLSVFQARERESHVAEMAHASSVWSFKTHSHYIHLIGKNCDGTIRWPSAAKECWEIVLDWAQGHLNKIRILWKGSGGTRYWVAANNLSKVHMSYLQIAF